MEQAEPRPPRPWLAFAYSIPIGTLGGLIGLGGAEFRLPVLAGPLGYPARQAVPINLAVSLVTVTAALAIRGQTLSYDPVAPHLPAVLALIAGAVFSAFWGATLGARLSNERLERIIFYLLAIIGTALIVEAFLPQEIPALLPALPALRIAAGVLFGLLIGLVSSLLGVAGGELIIPTLVFFYGVDIRTAGTASLIISLPTVLIGILRYASRGGYRPPAGSEHRSPWREVIAPMGVGSVIGAAAGGLLVGLIPIPALKFILGTVLIASAVKIFRKGKK
jgi:uncharacterized protein